MVSMTQSITINPSLDPRHGLPPKAPPRSPAYMPIYLQMKGTHHDEETL
jgi:hypothetical protein